nr:MAG TPA: hypothetical protein [Caudoviricetes sp.]
MFFLILPDLCWTPASVRASLQWVSLLSFDTS